MVSAEESVRTYIIIVSFLDTRHNIEFKAMLIRDDRNFVVRVNRRWFRSTLEGFIYFYVSLSLSFIFFSVSLYIPYLHFLTWHLYVLHVRVLSISTRVQRRSAQFWTTVDEAVPNYRVILSNSKIPKSLPQKMGEKSKNRRKSSNVSLRFHDFAQTVCLSTPLHFILLCIASLRFSA